MAIVGPRWIHFGTTMESHYSVTMCARRGFVARLPGRLQVSWPGGEGGGRV